MLYKNLPWGMHQTAKELLNEISTNKKIEFPNTDDDPDHKEFQNLIKKMLEVNQKERIGINELLEGFNKISKLEEIKKINIDFNSMNIEYKFLETDNYIQPAKEISEEITKENRKSIEMANSITKDGGIQKVNF